MQAINRSPSSHAPRYRPRAGSRYSIQSASGDELLVTPDLARTGGTYEIITAFPLVTATDLHKADTVLWHDVEFVVISVGRFGNFGGQWEGVMTIKDISPKAGLR